MKVRLQLPGDLRFYYPDAQVICRSNPDEDSFQDQPTLIAEVISESTRRADEGEKRLGYLGLASVELYLLVETERPLIIGYRRTPNGILREVYSGLEAVVPLGFLESELPLSEVYQRVAFAAAG